MNKDIRERWLERLESGEIKQTRGYLGRPSGSRCCLGVLCDIAVEDGIIAAPVEDMVRQHTKQSKFLRYEGEMGMLPRAVIVWAGLKDNGEVAVFYNDKHEALGDLVTRNDTSKYNFKKIAKIVREHF